MRQPNEREAGSFPTCRHGDGWQSLGDDDGLGQAKKRAQTALVRGKRPLETIANKTLPALCGTGALLMARRLLLLER